MVGHVVTGNVFASRLLAGASATEALAGLDEQMPPDLLVAVSESGELQLAAFTTADRHRTLHHPIGDISFETFLRLRLGDLVVHAWDLVVGADLDVGLDPGVSEALWVRVAPHVDEMRAMGSYGEGASGALPEDASHEDLLLDAFGRRP